MVHDFAAITRSVAGNATCFDHAHNECVHTGTVGKESFFLEVSEGHFVASTFSSSNYSIQQLELIPHFK